MSTAALNSVSPALEGHLIALDSQWSVWRWVGLRGAGFPAADIRKLRASGELLKLADQVFQRDKELETCRLAAIEAINAALDQLRREQQWDDKSRRVPLLKVRHGLKIGNVARIPDSLLSLPGILRYCEARTESENTKTHFRDQFLDSVDQQSGVIRDIAASSRFREAVTWQNRSAVQTAVLSLLRAGRSPQARDSRQRQNEELIAGYFQRYSVKNDTIGFFGPVGWARIVPEGRLLEVNPGPALVTARKVYFEAWAIEKLAETIARDVRVFPFLAPIRMPFLRLEASMLHHPVFGATSLCHGDAAVLARCDGVATAKQIASELIRLPGSPFTDVAGVYEVLAGLARRRLIHWGFVVPLGVHPENAIQKVIERIDDGELNAQALSLLRRLDAAREQVQTSAGSAEALDSALDYLERTFTDITGMPATRHHGKTYGARTIAYEDCRRDVEVLIGPDLVESLARPLSLLLASARWLTSEIARVYKSRLKEMYTSLVARLKSHSIDAATFWVEAMPYLLGDQSGMIGPVQEEFQRKWDRILGLSTATQGVAHSAEELENAVRAEFPSSRAGWNRARYHSPDLMIAAPSVEAIRRGEYLFVLGELHVATNSLEPSLFVKQHPCPEDLRRAADRDLVEPTVIPILPKEYQLASRTVAALVRPKDWFLEYAPDGLAPERSRALPVSSLVIEEHDGELLARSRDGQLSISVIELVGGFQALVRDTFKLMVPGTHNYRVAIDRLVIIRESWRLPAETLSFVVEQDPAARFLGARAWARQNGLPPCVFFKVPVEDKPAYLDFASPILIDLFSKMVRRTLEAKGPAAIVEFSEALPGIEDAWLPDSEGNRYTSEFRMVAVGQSS